MLRKIIKGVKEFVVFAETVAGVDDSADTVPVAVAGKRRITIDDLSAIWLQYNREVEPIRHRRNEEVAGTSGSPGGAAQTAPAPAGMTSAPAAKTKPAAMERPVIKSTVFYEDVIMPNKDVIERMGVMKVITKLIEFLDTYGNCPSMVNMARDEEAQDLYTVESILLKVSLKEHTFNVVKFSLKYLKEQYRDWENLVPKTIIAALGHDIGKVPELRNSSAYAKADHPIISEQKVRQFFDGMPEVFWLNDVCEAILGHHRQSKDQFTSILKKADISAREVEISNGTKDLVLKPWVEWFKVDELIKEIRPYINVSQRAKWEAFSFGSVVYCEPNLLYDKAKAMATRAKVLDMTLIVAPNKEIALNRIVDSLRAAGMLVDGVPPGRYGMFYKIAFQQGSKRSLLTPIKIEAFGIASELGRLREGMLAVIKNVTLATK